MAEAWGKNIRKKEGSLNPEDEIKERKKAEWR